MEQSKQEAQIYQEDEIDLRALFNSLVARRFLIAGLTGFVTVLAILYALNIAPTYKVSSSFISPSAISVTTINKLGLIFETKESVFSKFLTQLSSKDLQKIAFVEGDFLTLFNPDNSPIDDVDAFISRTTSSVRVNKPRMTKKDQDLGFLNELPYSVTMEGERAESISEYLNTLVALANSKTIIELINHNELKISNRLDEISLERELLLEQAEKDRFSQIERIKEEDGQKIREINDQIGRARYKAKENRLNQIVILTKAANLAKSLDVIENNLNIFKNINAVNIAIGESNNLPDWYLYGEKALKERIELLVNLKSDDPFIPELVTLNNQLNEVQNNNLLKTLETRQDDSPFIAKIVELDIEKIKLESTIVSMNGVSSMQLSQISLPPKSPIKPNKRMIVLLAFIGSFMMSVFLALILGVLKPDKKVSPT
jgi:LPS O-antigen subunit length determinant protein (WzzB/FepE family)